jgi:tetratricopeptide (TPR) repeat protein/tRNA A-37 threonylcarbamoyl transferase component Bud32
MPATDRDLLYAILALRREFITHDQFRAALTESARRPDTTLTALLREKTDLDDAAHAALERSVQTHLDAAVELADGQATILANDASATVSQAGSRLPADQRFRKLRPHAAGALGRVSVALDEELHREVALKEINDRYADDAQSRRRFVLEAEITGGLEHPGIVPVYGLGQYPDGRPYYAMRLIRGSSLGQAIKQFHEADVPGRDPGLRGLALRDLLARFEDVCDAIQYAHDRGIVHRDLKPGNVMLGDYGETLVVDWGLAKPTGMTERSGADGEPPLQPASPMDLFKTQVGSALGTPAYMSPEQASGRLDLVGTASDVYSLGATLYCLLTGRAPFDDADDILPKVVRGKFPRPSAVKPGVPAALEAICLRAMAHKPENRYASPRALADDLKHWLADEPVSAWAEPWTIKTRRFLRRHRPLASAVAAALLVALVGLAAAALWHQNQESTAAHKRALAQQAVRQCLERTEATCEQLSASLRAPGGVQALLNQPARWEAQIKAARGEWLQARSLLDHAEISLDPDLAHALSTWDKQLTDATEDLRLAQRLEEVRLDRAAWVDGRFDYTGTEGSYRKVFDEAGLSVEHGDPEDVSRRIEQSAIKDQLLAALDDWAFNADILQRRELAARLTQVARLADPDPWRDRVRDPGLWKTAAMANLAAEADNETKVASRLSPQMLLLIGMRLPRGPAKERWLRKAQAAHPVDFWLNFELGWYLYEKKTKQSALEAAGFYRVALSLRPRTSALYNNLALALWVRNDLDAAIDACRKALAIDPNYAHAWNNLGLALRDRKDPHAAIDAFNKAIAINPGYSFAWNNLGLALWDLKDLPAAVAAYKKALAIDPRYAHAWNNLGLLHRDRKNLAAAVAAFKQALGIDPQYAYAWVNLGQAFAQGGDLAAAMDALNKALTCDPEYALACNALAWLLATSPDAKYRDGNRAVELAQKALTLQEAANHWDTLAAAHAEAGNFSEAVRCQQRALRDSAFERTHGGEARARLKMYGVNKPFRVQRVGGLIPFVESF